MRRPNLSADEISRAIYKLNMENPADRTEETIVLLREIAYQLAKLNERAENDVFVKL